MEDAMIVDIEFDKCKPNVKKQISASKSFFGKSRISNNRNQ
jgi:hypothetical protein